MRGHPLAGEAWAGTRSSQTVFADQMFQGITREWIATDGREQRPIIVAAPFFQPVLQGLGGIPTKRRATFLANFTQSADRRSEERRGGKECVSTCGSRRSP